MRGYNSPVPEQPAQTLGNMHMCFSGHLAKPSLPLPSVLDGFLLVFLFLSLSHFILFFFYTTAT